MANDHLNIVQNKLGQFFYLERPFSNYGFIQLPRFDFTHNQEILFNTKNLTNAFIEAVNECKNKIYPLYFNHNIREEHLSINRWSNIFIFNGAYIQRDLEGNPFAYFMIYNNDMAENYLQALCELLIFVDVEKTKIKLELFNKELYDYLNIDYVVLEMNKLGVYHTKDLLSSGEDSENTNV